MRTVTSLFFGLRSPVRIAALLSLALLGLAMTAALVPARSEVGTPYGCGYYPGEEAAAGYEGFIDYANPCPDNPGQAIDKIAGERVKQMVQHGQLARILLGSYEQINCTNTCISAFGAIGSFSAGFHGRKYLTDRVSLIGGLSINEYKSGSVSAKQAFIAAAALRYDFVDWGSSRPFFEIGGSISPSERSRFTRTYSVGGTNFTSQGKGRSESYMIYGRVGWVTRVTPRDEFAIFGDLVRQWQHSGRITETPSPTNPFPAVYGSGQDVMDVVRVTAQHVHLFGSRIELHVHAGVSHSFNIRSGVQATIAPLGVFTPSLGRKTWLEYGARVGFRLNKRLTLDTFLIGASGPKPIGNSLHGGIGVRAVF